jgi:fumarylacetoacetase
MFYDIDLEVLLTPKSGAPQRICQTNASELYYSAAQQLTHHTSAGCPMRVGDLLGSGTISGAARGARGSMLELSWGGEIPLDLPDGTRRSFLEDGDTITLRGAAQANDFRIGFGECTGMVLPAAQDPFKGD